MIIMEASYYNLINKREPETHVAVLYTISGEELIQIVLEKEEWWCSTVPRIDSLLDPNVSSKARPTDVSIHNYDIKTGSMCLLLSIRTVTLLTTSAYDGPGDLVSLVHHLRKKTRTPKVDYDWVLANNIPLRHQMAGHRPSHLG